eukprot:7151898-Pyramimonas_sp.AAC.1
MPRQTMQRLDEQTAEEHYTIAIQSFREIFRENTYSDFLGTTSQCAHILPQLFVAVQGFLYRSDEHKPISIPASA